jgi:hypothetical protein
VVTSTYKIDDATIQVTLLIRDREHRYRVTDNGGNSYTVQPVDADAEGRLRCL